MEFDDLYNQVQQSIEIYGYLSDRWEGMSGTFMGKDYSIVFDLFSVFAIDTTEEQQLILRILSMLDSIRSELISKKQKEREQKPSS